ncbi:MAG: glycosyl hydrolase [Cyclobacteriaceae bacterium]|nr:glycosyl hydrolase [Cyclobacteriaceae bacterium]MCB0498827.1 glycosyl hydrolase [Cyclobacteriaceae bacterium]MCB9237659.1 glycosyl hydrolase [Flammeovirgaceae bacterium]MCO5270239.1 glycosyl hydrolase [Cyclobacteriaceae bacterium]MCW5902215.1 glycosyl hydrolase [Cyclobacteriaceae bacterium]
MANKYLTVLVLAAFLAIDAPAQRKKGSVQANPSGALSFNQEYYEGIRWRELGPFRGGRSVTVTGVVGDPNTYYFGGVGGGVWKSEDAGQTWFNITDKYFGGTIGAVAVSESDPNVVYVGEGEQGVRSNVSSGWGVWKSTDAGTTWKHIGLTDSKHIGRIRIHPKNPDLVYVAAMGNLWKPNNMRGVYRSKDGGATWERVLYINDKAGAVDLTFDPNNARILYASTWNITRNGYRMDSGGSDSKLWKSIDGGDTWDELTDNPGMPGGTNGIIGVAVSPMNSNRVWAIIENVHGGVFRSDDAGATWKKVNEDRELRQRAWYYTRITADTQNEDKVWVMNVSYGVSKDGGVSFELKNAPHGDHHDLWIDPDNNQRMIIADDGGAQVSNDGGENWTTYHNQPTAQFYRVSTDNHFPYRIYGAQQDNSSVRINHRGTGTAITERDWVPLALGESAHVAPDPLNNNIVYGGGYKGYMNMENLETGQERSTNVWPDLPAGSGAEVMKYRFNWNYPVVFSTHDPKKLYAGSNHLHVTTNGGQSWEVISPDLTRNDPETIKSSGGPITQDNTGAEYYANIFVITESPYTENEIWTGSDDGLVYLTKDGGKTWENVTPPMASKNNMMNSIDVNPFVKGGAYVVGTSYKFGDNTPYIYKTEDYGKTWKLITHGIPDEEFVRVVRADPKRKGLLYAGTEKGMWVSFDDGASWSAFQLNLPPVPIHDLAVKEDNLIAATHGRSFWMIDDLTPLHQMSKEIEAKKSYLFKPMPSYRMAGGSGWGRRDARLEGENHPGGVMMHYYVATGGNEEVSIDIMEMDGDIIQTFSNKSKERATQLKVKKGGNRFVWNMRYPGYKTFPGLVFYSSPNIGPKAVPGKYKARLTANGQVTEQEFEIVKDPRVPTTQQEFQEQFDFLSKVRDKVSEAHQGILDIRKIKTDLGYVKTKVEEKPENKGLLDAMKKFQDDLTVIENDIHQTKNQAQQDPLNFGIKLNNRLAFLLYEEGTGDYPPTRQAEQVRQELSRQIDDELNKLNALIDSRVPAINEMIKGKGIEMIMIKKGPTDM